MHQTIGYITLLVKDYDEAICFYTQKLRFNIIEDSNLGNGKRWILVSPPGASETCILLAKAATPDQEKQIGNQTGGRVFLFLHTDDFHRDYEEMIRNGIRFLEKPRYESYGTVAVFEDIYRNKWDLLELKDPANGRQHKAMT